MACFVVQMMAAMDVVEVVRDQLALKAPEVHLDHGDLSCADITDVSGIYFPQWNINHNVSLIEVLTISGDIDTVL